MATNEPKPPSSNSTAPPGLRGSSYSWLIPIITVIVVLAIVIVGLLIQHNSAVSTAIPAPPEEMPPPEQLYTQNCAMCHGQDGQSTAARYPPLVDTRWVLEDTERLILITLYGLRGRIEVQDRTYDGIMPPFAHRLSDEEIASILTYIRQSWQNDAPAISTEEVRQVRENYPAPQDPWTVDRLRDQR